MRYPDSIIEMYERLKNVEEALVQVEERTTETNDLGAFDQLNNTLELFSALTARIYEEADIYAAETGADRDGSHDPDRLLDDLENQHNESL
jgi:hypothetical protein